MHVNRNWKAKKGLIRVSMDVENGVINNIKISGDFFMFPEESINELENMLKGSKIDNIKSIIDKFYNEGIITPGVEPQDFVNAIAGE
ncbi:lipoate protein ligase C-terminal domain-containing protein [Thermoplasma volcanium]|nr:lipoate protein ligase C-terminal domain-containing protein [Thermoplasma volcanium]